MNVDEEIQTYFSVACEKIIVKISLEYENRY